MKTLVQLVILCLIPIFSFAQHGMMKIEGDSYTPLFGTIGSKVEVNSFLMDSVSVTNQEFVEFVVKNPEWRRSKVLRLYADKNYLQDWENDTTLSNNQLPDAPVTNVSWFVATAYATSKGKRLPTTDEWEFVAMASATKKDARKDSLFSLHILSWYEMPKTYSKPVGKTKPNLWGVRDLYGLIWEWTEDFNSILMTGESRGDVDENKNLFCGGGSVGANDLMNYAAFMRFAFKGSLKANYCVQNLGFRCVKDIEL